MAAAGDKRLLSESVLLVLLIAALVVSVLLTLNVGSGSDGDSGGDEKPVGPLDIEKLESAKEKLSRRWFSSDAEPQLFVSELRVVAIGSAYPIPYEAEICPYSQMPQPSMDQLDRDGDGITDDWEERFGLDRYNIDDASQDQDGDGFSSLEEFLGGTDPTDASDHPAYAEKLRFVQRKDIDFPLVFQGFTELTDGSYVFQMNNPATGKSHFLSAGESAEGIEVKRFEMDEGGRDHRLFVERAGYPVELIRGETALDPESQAELINLLDRSRIMVTMGALLSLHNDEYTVLGVYADKVVLKDTATGKVYDIVGLTEGELIGDPEDRL